MNRVSIYLIVILGLVLSGNRLFALSFSDMETQYAKDRENIAWKYVEKQNYLRNGYTNALVALEVAFKSKGNLDGVLAVRREREQLAALINGKDPEGRTISEIADLRVKQRKAAGEVVLEEKRAIVAIAQQYVDRLKTLEKELTVADNIDAALVVQQKRKKVMEEQDVVTAQAVLKESSGVRQADVPGRFDDMALLADPKDGSKALFNGNDLNGWGRAGGAWQAEERIIKGISEGGFAKLSVGEWPGQDYEFMLGQRL